MKINRYFSILAAATAMFAACQKEEMVTFHPENVVPPVLHAVEDVVVTTDNKSEQVTFTWDKADFGFNAEVFYSLDMKLGEKSISLFSGITGDKMAVSYEALNNKVFNEFGITEGSGEFDLLLGAKLKTSDIFYADPVKIKVTPTAAEKVYPMIYVLGNFCDWDAKGQMQHLFDFKENDKDFSGVIGFGGLASEGFKIRGTEEGWDNSCNWGIQGENTDVEPSTIQLCSDGGSEHIKNYSKDYYHFTFDKSTLVLKVNKSFTQVGLIGINNDWDNDIVMKFNPAKQVFYADVEVAADGEFKFRFDADWNAGDYGGDLKALTKGGANIAIEAGNYRIYLNMNNPDAVTGTLDKKAYNTGDEGFEVVTPEPEPEPGPLPEGARPVKLLMKSMGWSTNNLYGWGMATELIWPGVASEGTVEFSGQKYEYWTIAKENWGKTGVGLIFNNGTEQTIDIKDVVLDGDKCYELGAQNGDGKFEYSEAALPIVKITYKNEENWENVSVHGWGDDFSLGEWPGQPMQKVGNEWVLELPAEHIGKTVNFIFNNNNNGKQTVDLGPFVLDKDYSFDNSNAQIK